MSTNADCLATSHLFVDAIFNAITPSNTIRVLTGTTSEPGKEPRSSETSESRSACGATNSLLSTLNYGCFSTSSLHPLSVFRHNRENHCILRSGKAQALGNNPGGGGVKGSASNKCFVFLMWFDALKRTSSRSRAAVCVSLREHSVVAE